MKIFIHGCAATPMVLLDALGRYGKAANLHDVELIHIHTEGPAVLARPEFEGGFLIPLH